MNKTLQYILIFAICFAAAMLVGRLFKGEKVANNESINQEEVDYYNSLEKKLEKEQQYFRPAKQKHEKLDNFHKGENEFIKCEYFNSIYYDSLLEAPYLDVIPSNKNLTLKINTSTPGFPEEVDLLFNTEVKNDSLHIAFFKATVPLEYNQPRASAAVEWYLTIDVKDYKKYKGVYLSQKYSSDSKSESEKLIWTNK